jgi:transposase
MMVKVLPYAYCTGAYGSHRIARRLHEDIAFRLLAPAHTVCKLFQAGPRVQVVLGG